MPALRGIVWSYCSRGGSPKIRSLGAAGAPNSAQKRREAALLPRRPGKKGKEGGGRRGGGGEGPYLLFLRPPFTGDSRTAVLPMISCRQSQKLTRFADCGPAAIRDLALEDLSGQYISKKKRDGAHL
jgi:hypothetical protein